MGAPTSNRKRDGHFSSSKPFSAFFPSSPIDFDLSPSLPSAKRLKPSHDRMSPDPVVFNPPRQPPPRVSTYSRVKRYPSAAPYTREVHGPVQRFRSSVVGAMGNTLRRKSVGKERELEVAKKKAIRTIKHVKLDEEVVDVDRECSDSQPVVLDDSSDDDLEIFDRGRNQKPVETNEGAYRKETYPSFSDYGGRASSSVVSDLSNQTPKDDEDYTIISRNSAVDLTVPPHKRMHQVAEMRTPKLLSIDFQISLVKKIILSRFRPAKSPQQNLLKEAFVELTEDEEAEVSRALSHSCRRKVLVTHPDSNIEITGDLLQCLRPGAWLNDEVINLYLELLKEREKREPQKFLKCHFFNTFFYKKLISGRAGYDFKAVRRWTTQRKIGYALIDCDKIFIPIHKEIHWCLAIINKKDKKFQYLDSLKGKDSRVLQVLAKYYVDEVKDKSAKDIDVSSWEQEYVQDLPAQENGFDCGMFMIKYADFYSRGLSLAFVQKHMPYFRKRTAKEILNLKAE